MYEHVDIFGDKLTVSEIEYWSAFNIIKAANHYDVQWRNLTFDEIVEDIESAKRKQDLKMKGIK